jgi:hypothetical protein
LKARENLIKNRATDAEANFIAHGQRVEPNMLTSRQFIEFVEEKLGAHGIGKVVPDADTLQKAWDRAHLVQEINAMVDAHTGRTPAMPGDLADQIRASLARDDGQSWDAALAVIARNARHS